MTNAVTGLLKGETTQRIHESQNLILNANNDIVGIQNMTGTGQDFRAGSGSTNTSIDGGNASSNYGATTPINGGGAAG